MSARVGEAGDDLIALADELFDVIVKIWKSGADFAHVLFELFNAIHGSADRTAGNDVAGDEFFESCGAPRIPEFRVVSAEQSLVVRQERNPLASGVFPTRRTQRPIWAPPAKKIRKELHEANRPSEAVIRLQSLLHPLLYSPACLLLRRNSSLSMPWRTFIARSMRR